MRTLARAVPVPAGAGRARLLVERNARAWRHVWIVLVSGFFEPVFYLFSLGIGIGALVGGVDVGDGRSVPYANFVAPALLAASAMNGAVYDATLNIFYKLKYARLYDSILATPLGPRDIAVGEITWALLAVPAAVLLGLAFAGAGMAATTFMRSWQDFDLVQLVVLPMFLFSATFYPLSAYPPALQWVVQATPLYHAVALERQLLLGTVDAGIAGHVAYLVAMGLVGLVIAARRLESLLLK